MVIVKTEFAVGCPDICRLPVINGISIENVITYFRGPAVIVVHLILPVQMDAAPTVKTLLRTNAYEKSRHALRSSSHAAIWQNASETHNPTFWEYRKEMSP